MNIAIIPARIGSKRIPKKNIKIFHGKPIIYYSIKAAKKTKLFKDIICSTDDSEIVKIAEKYGAKCPFLRPKRLSNDFSSTSDVINHTIDFYNKKGKKLNFICCIYPTAPFIRTKKIIEGYDKILNEKWKFVFSATKNPLSVLRTFEKKFNGSLKMLFPSNFKRRSQDLKNTYFDAAQFYWGSANSWKKNNNLFNFYSTIVEIPYHESIDIDTMEDWKLAELIFKNKK